MLIMTFLRENFNFCDILFNSKHFYFLSVSNTFVLHTEEEIVLATLIQSLLLIT